jgi:hypothetical protein
MFLKAFKWLRMCDYLWCRTRTLKKKSEIDTDSREIDCYDATMIFLHDEIVAMGRRSINVDVAVLHR